MEVDRREFDDTSREDLGEGLCQDRDGESVDVCGADCSVCVGHFEAMFIFMIMILVIIIFIGIPVVPLVYYTPVHVAMLSRLQCDAPHTREASSWDRAFSFNQRGHQRAHGHGGRGEHGAGPAMVPSP